MLKSVEAVIEPTGEIRLLEPVKVDTPHRAIVTILENPSSEEPITLLSEPALAEDWLRPEEERAWKHFQKGR